MNPVEQQRGRRPAARIRSLTLRALVAVAVVGSATACTAMEVSPPPTGLQTATPSTTSSAGSAHAPSSTAGSAGSALAGVPTPPTAVNGKVLIRVSGQGTREMTTTLAGKALRVAINCRGKGLVTVTVDHVGSGGLRCATDATPSWSMNEMDLRYAPGPTTVRVDAPPEQRWAITVAEGEPTARS